MILEIRSGIAFFRNISDNIGAGRNTLFTHVIELTFKRTVSSPTMRGHNNTPRSNRLINDETRGIFYNFIPKILDIRILHVYNTY